jgi:hypothetical protein
VWGVGLSHEIRNVVEAETVPRVEGSRDTVVSARRYSFHRGLRPDHARKDNVGTQEAPSGPTIGHVGGARQGRTGALP